VERDVAASVHPVERSADRGWVDQDVRVVTANTERVGGRVLAEQEMVLLAVEQRVLKVPALGVVDRAEPADSERGVAIRLVRSVGSVRPARHPSL
jgi:hypothetical protein